MLSALNHSQLWSCRSLGYDSVNNAAASPTCSAADSAMKCSTVQVAVRVTDHARGRLKAVGPSHERVKDLLPARIGDPENHTGIRRASGECSAIQVADRVADHAFVWKISV